MFMVVLTTTLYDFIAIFKNLTFELFNIVHDMEPKYLSDHAMKKDTQHELCSEHILEIPKYNTVNYGIDPLSFS